MIVVGKECGKNWKKLGVTQSQISPNTPAYQEFLWLSSLTLEISLQLITNLFISKMQMVL